MSEPRGVAERIAWMLANEPGKVGQCARWCWYALGGNQTPPSPPRWGTEDANAVYDKVIASKRYWRTTPIPLGALIVWKYGDNGHTAISAGGGRIVTTDPSGQPGGTGYESLSYPERWGATPARRIWTDEYAGVRFATGGSVSNNLDYKYLGKPPGTLWVGRSYVTLGGSFWTPPRSGLEGSQVYLNIAPTFKAGKTHGALRPRLVREDGDDTGHNDLPIDIDDLDDDGKTLRRILYWEKGSAGDSSKFQLKCIGGLESVTIGTRYTKRYTVID